MSFTAKAEDQKKAKHNLYRELKGEPEDGVTATAIFRDRAWVRNQLETEYPDALVGHVKGENILTVFFQGADKERFLQGYQNFQKAPATLPFFK